MTTLSPLMRAYYEEKHSIKYRREFARITGGVLSAIFLQQVFYWFVGETCEKFYKFGYPCDHAKYKAGDSWTEELGFSRSEFENARRRIATKITKGVKKAELMAVTKPEFDERGVMTNANYLILYWTDSSKVTWYWLNAPLLENAINQHFLENAENLQRLDNAEKSHRNTMRESSNVFSSETTTKTTTKKKERPAKIAKVIFPDDMRDWTRKHIETYYGSNTADLDTLTSAFYDGSLLKLTITRMPDWDCKGAIQTHRDCVRSEIPQDEYPLLIRSANKKFAWKKNINWRDVQDTVSDYLIERSKRAAKSVINLDPALDLSIQHPVTPMLLDRAGGDK